MSTSKKVTKTLTAAIAVAFVLLAGSAQAETTGSAQYQPVHPLGWEIPAPGTPGRLPSSTHAEGSVSPKGVSPLGWEIPAPGARGAKAPVRNDTVAYMSHENDVFRHLGGIGGRNTP